MFWRVCLGAAGLAAAAVSAAAQSAKTEPAPAAKLEVVTGQGLFELRLGKSVDLTKNQWLLSFVGDNRPESLAEGRVNIKIAGAGWWMRTGDRLNLKTFNTTQKDAKDKDQCYLDLIEVVAPKGAPATATFRFHCL